MLTFGTPRAAPLPGPPAYTSPPTSVGSIWFNNARLCFSRPLLHALTLQEIHKCEFSSLVLALEHLMTAFPQKQGFFFLLMKSFYSNINTFYSCIFLKGRQRPSRVAHLQIKNSNKVNLLSHYSSLCSWVPGFHHGSSGSISKLSFSV